MTQRTDGWIHRGYLIAECPYCGKPISIELPERVTPVALDAWLQCCQMPVIVIVRGVRV